jgi:hypothetical protein
MTEQHMIPSHANYPGRALHRRIADRHIARARSEMIASGEDIGPHIRIPMSDGARIAAFRSSDRIRFEVIAIDGSYATDLNSGEAGRLIADLIGA